MRLCDRVIRARCLAHFQHREVAVEVHSAGGQADGRHDDVVDQGIHHRGKRDAHDERYCQLQQVPLVDKVLELSDHLRLPFLSRGFRYVPVSLAYPQAPVRVPDSSCQ